MIKAIIFDMDGVVIDSEPLWVGARILFLKNKGVENPKEYYKYRPQLMGLNAGDVMKILKKKFPLPEKVNKLIKDQEKITSELFKKKIKAVPGVAKIIRRLAKSKIKLGLATSSSKKLALVSLKKTKLAKYFDYILSGEQVKRGKPHPDIFLKVAKKFKAKPSQCLVFEDSPNGILAAKRAKMTCIALRHKLNKGQDLSLADKIISSWQKLNINQLI